MFAVLLTKASANRVVHGKENPEENLWKARDAECENFALGSVYAIEKALPDGFTFTHTTHCKCRTPQERVFCEGNPYRMHNHYFHTMQAGHPCAGLLRCLVEEEPAGVVEMRQEAAQMERYNCAPGQGQAAEGLAWSTYNETGDNSYEACAKLCDEDVECQGFDLTLKESSHPELFSLSMKLQKPDSCRLYKENTPRLGDAGLDNRRYCTKMAVKVETYTYQVQGQPRTVKGGATGQDSTPPETSDPVNPETSEPVNRNTRNVAALQRARQAREKKDRDRKEREMKEHERKLAAAEKELEDVQHERKEHERKLAAATKELEDVEDDEERGTNDGLRA